MCFHSAVSVISCVQVHTELPSLRGKELQSLVCGFIWVEGLSAAREKLWFFARSQKPSASYKKKTDSFWFPPLGWLSLENTEGDSLWWRRWQFLRICLCFNFLSLLNLAFILKMCSFRHPQPEFWSLFMRVQELAEVWILSLLKLWMSWEGEGRGWTPTEPPLSLPAPPVWAQEDQVSSCLLFKAAELFWSGSVD